jgi:hypothetical protein
MLKNLTEPPAWAAVLVVLDRFRGFTMLHNRALKRHGAPDDPAGGALFLFGLIAATGFAVGWMARALWL